MTIVDNLKKFAARIATANGDVSAVQGNSISEIISFMGENLNVDADGNLAVYVPVLPIAIINSSCKKFIDSELRLSSAGGYLGENAYGVQLAEPVMTGIAPYSDKVKVTYKIGDETKEITTILDRPSLEYEEAMIMGGSSSNIIEGNTAGSGDYIKYFAYPDFDPITGKAGSVHVIAYFGKYATELPEVQIIGWEKVEG